MKREKPQQQIYRPGSGPLRKSITGGGGSGGGTESSASESDTNLILNSRSVVATIQNQTTTCDDNKFIRNNNNKSSSEGPSMDQHRFDSREGPPGGFRKQKKPEQALYKPPSAQNRDVSGAGQAQLAPHDNYDHNFYSQSNGNDNKFNKGNRRVRKRGEEDNWRGKSPSRQMRQGSEPRGLPNGSGPNWQQRGRDTRSVEPTLATSQSTNRSSYDTKMQSKPPSGRRHSTIGMEADKRQKINSLPPRFQKKLLGEKYNQQMQQPVEENWNGTTMMFQGSNNPPTNYLKNPSYHQMHNYIAVNNGNVGYHTLPTKPRGRGRLQDYDVSQINPGGFSSMPPMEQIRSPCNSRPATPPPFSNRPKGDSRPQTPVKQITDDMKQLAVEDRGKKISVFDRLGDRQDRFSNNSNSSGNYREYRRDRQDRNDRGDRNDRNDRSDRNDRNDRRDRRVDRRDNYNNNRMRNDRGGDWSGIDRKNDGFARHEKTSKRQSIENDRSTENQSQSNDSLKSTELLQEAMKKLQPMTTSLDWSEEVEMNDRLEQEALSDALTRSSSINSLVDISTKSVPITKEKRSHRRRHNRKRSKQRNRSGSRNRDSSNTRSNTALSRQSSVDNREFKVPMEVSRSRRRRHSRDRRDSSYDRYHHNSSRDCSFDRHRKSSTSECENWREEIIRSRQNSERSRNNSETLKLEDLKMDGGVKKGGVLFLPKSPDSKQTAPVFAKEQPRYPDVKKIQQKSLFDPNNPGKPIIVKAQSSRASTNTISSPTSHPDNTESVATDHFGNTCPYWYNESSDQFKSCHNPELLLDIRRADQELQSLIISGYPLMNNPQLEALRKFLQEALEYLLCNSMKFCQRENVEQHFWRMLYYNVIEITRKAILTEPEDKEKYKGFLLNLIDEGTKYFERLLVRLEETYQFQLNDYLGHNSLSGRKSSGLVGLALVSAQKILMFLGDLCRYKEQVNETSNYGKCRQWYIKSHEINPKNGKPYNQLAVLAVYARRKLDAVYYYMRSLMSSNPVPSARENLISLFDENSKKYVQGEKKRREERLEKLRKQMKQKESENNTNSTGCLRNETWIRPDGGRRVHRTTQTMQDQKDSEEEDLAALSSVEVNKRFVISYLHVQGKLITKIGLETFQEAGMQMLKEFRALLQHSPVPLPCNRFLQLLALNMFAIENTQLKDPKFESVLRSESQERALVISLQMFNLILERCVSILQDHLQSNSAENSLPPDANVLLPAIKIWCDWMLYHSHVWNPPPSTQDFKVGTSGDAWGRLAVLMNLLERMDTSAPNTFLDCPKEGYELVRLPEDGVLYGFTPLMLGTDKPSYAPHDMDVEVAQFHLRLKKLLFFGTVFLCGLEPPVLKLEIEDNFREYISVVCLANSRDSPPSPQELTCNNDVLLESVSGDEDDGDGNGGGRTEEIVNMNAPSEVRELLSRKKELERRHRHQELRMQQVKKILSQSVVSVHIEVRPRYLVPDTNCFIDHLDRIVVLAASHCYTLMVPIVVLSELEGLAKGGNGPLPGTRTSLDPQHIRRVGESAKSALDFMKSRHQNVKCVTTKGAILTSTTFTTEDDSTLDSCLKNDDKILATCLVLCKSKDPPSVEGQPRELVREVVLLTEDRNLRVKAYARDVPVRELPDFMQWAGLG